MNIITDRSQLSQIRTFIDNITESGDINMPTLISTQQLETVQSLVTYFNSIGSNREIGISTENAEKITYEITRSINNTQTHDEIALILQQYITLQHTIEEIRSIFMPEEYYCIIDHLYENNPYEAALVWTKYVKCCNYIANFTMLDEQLRTTLRIHLTNKLQNSQTIVEANDTIECFSNGAGIIEILTNISGSPPLLNLTVNTEEQYEGQYTVISDNTNLPNLEGQDGTPPTEEEEHRTEQSPNDITLQDSEQEESIYPNTIRFIPPPQVGIIESEEYISEVPENRTPDIRFSPRHMLDQINRSINETTNTQPEEITPNTDYEQELENINIPDLTEFEEKIEEFVKSFKELQKNERITMHQDYHTNTEETTFKGWYYPSGKCRVFKYQPESKEKPLEATDTHNINRYSNKFDWGYNSDGAYQLAIALLMETLQNDNPQIELIDIDNPETKAKQLHKKFTNQVLKFLPNSWSINISKIQEWIEREIEQESTES